ncbi:hypothetical protein GIB67_037073 [Kingdonia uniflora]|uniref:Squalene monooxygenase n=1 Tax=Kingdonia uniflora TaxID=39325 RepID=A0A7J7LHP0_9MAGN|nr:hypothetical protein GIB67_037073 [Kingdonia uniflora]
MKCDFQVPPQLYDSFIATIDKGSIKTMQNRSMPADPHSTPAAVLMGDAFNMRHPLTGGGMTVALSDIAVLHNLLKPLRDLNDASSLCRYLESFYILRKVGAQIETELKEKKLRVEDALNAIKAAVEEGIVVGGGCTLLRLATNVDVIKLTLDNDEQKVLYGLPHSSYPLKLSVVIEKALFSDDFKYGYNAVTGKYEDLMAVGIIDPTKACWVLQKIGSYDDKRLQQFLDNVQYKCVGILRYEQISHMLSGILLDVEDVKYDLLLASGREVIMQQKIFDMEKVLAGERAKSVKDKAELKAQYQKIVTQLEEDSARNMEQLSGIRDIFAQRHLEDGYSSADIIALSERRFDNFVGPAFEEAEDNADHVREGLGTVYGLDGNVPLERDQAHEANVQDKAYTEKLVSRDPYERHLESVIAFYGGEMKKNEEERDKMHDFMVEAEVTYNVDIIRADYLNRADFNVYNSESILVPINKSQAEYGREVVTSSTPEVVDGYSRVIKKIDLWNV